MTTDQPALSVVIEPGSEGHRYNDDLLLDEKRRARAEGEFSRVFHILNHEKLRLTFRAKDEEANVAKCASQAWGVWAVVMALFSLMGGSSEAIWSSAPRPWPTIIAILSSVLGLSAVLITVFGVIHGKRKDQWLANRLMTERFRQFHFQEFASNLATLVASLADNDARDAYSIDRDKRFDELLDNLKRTRLGEVAAVIAPETRPPIWVHHSGYEEPQWPVGKLSADCLEKLFEAYAKFRFCEQIGYAGDMLRERNRPELEHKSSKTIQWPWYPGMKQPLKVKRTTLQFVWQFSLAFLVLLDSSILAAHLCSAHFADSPLIHVGVVWSALVAVAAKTLSDGLALTREIERYQEYLAVMVELAHAFEKSENEHQKWRIMVETEKASFEEMREFLRSNQEAVFVM